MRKYIYCSNNPVNIIDPQGMCEPWWEKFSRCWHRYSERMKKFWKSKIGETIKIGLDIASSLIGGGFYLEFDEKGRPVFPKPEDPAPIVKIIRIWRDPKIPLY